jgi:hypothetical protein
MKYFFLLFMLSGCVQIPAESDECTGYSPSPLAAALNATLNHAQIANCEAQKQAAIVQEQQQVAAQQQAEEQAQAEAAAQAAQQQQAADAAEALAVKAAEANPSPALVEFESEMGNDNSLMQIANAAIDCHLRTNIWFTVLSFGYRSDFMREREKIPLSEAEASVEQQFNTQATAVDSNNLDCSAMSTSDALSQVDQQESTWASQM